jgi:serpin B
MVESLSWKGLPPGNKTSKVMSYRTLIAMKDTRELITETLLCVCLLACPVLQGQDTISDAAAELVAGNNRFALDLFGELAAGEATGNVFISPWSISTAFGMAWAGARGETADEMADVLQFPRAQATTHPLFGELIGTLNGIQEEGKLVLNTANAIWPAEGHPVLPEYAETVGTHYGAHSESLDYRNKTEASRQRINGWVADNTADRIRDLIAKGILGEDTAVVLTNAIYFKGAWQRLFDPEETVDDTFHALDGSEIAVDMMQMREDLQFYEDDTVTLVTLPYHGEALEAVLLVPNSGTIADLEAALTPESLQTWLDGQQESEDVLVRLPRFSLRYKAELSSVLKALGMQLPFSPGAADFSGIFGRPDLFISKVIHETFLQVKEEGTEAAGATAIVIERTSVTPKPTFNGNRPFLFLIRDNVTGSLLFMGRIAAPEPVEDEGGNPGPDTVREWFGDGATLTDGWWENTGIGRFKADKWPWLEHASLGWLYLDTADGDPQAGYWLYDFSLGWLHSSAATFPNFWSEAEGWIWYLPSSSDPCWMYRYRDGGWFTK